MTRIIALDAIDQPLVDMLCEIIHRLYNESVEDGNFTERQLEMLNRILA